MIVIPSYPPQFKEDEPNEPRPITPPLNVGEILANVNPDIMEELNAMDLVQLMVGRELSLERTANKDDHGDVVLEAENLFGFTHCCSYQLLSVSWKRRKSRRLMRLGGKMCIEKYS
jgi:hypothetical protein